MDSTQLELAVSHASVSVAQACERQVGHVRNALAQACEAELGTLKAVLAEACSEETDKLREALGTACDAELARVSASLTTACAQEVEGVRTSCQREVERVKEAMRNACELEVLAVKEACIAEVEQVKLALKGACATEVDIVKEACRTEVQLVKDSLSEACRVEMASMAESMRRDVEMVRAEQRAELQEAAAPYLVAVEKAHAHTVGQLEDLRQALRVEQERAAASEVELAHCSRNVSEMVGTVRARERQLAGEVRLVGGMQLIVVRATKGIGALLFGGRRCQLQTRARTVRLSKGGDALLVSSASDPDAELETLPLSLFRTVRLGAPPRAIQAASEYLKEPTAARPIGSRRAWHYLTLRAAGEPPLILLAQTGEAAMAWASELAPRLAVLNAAQPVSTGAFLWQRVRLRLLATPYGSPLRAMAKVIRELAEEESARRVWVQHHLARGEEAQARSLGWVPSESSS